MQDLWSFATDFYARAGVENACLDLQAQGCDVCVLLTAVWLQSRQVACHNEHVQALKNASQQWQQDVISPLRTLRQLWKANAQEDATLAALREQVKRLELSAERTLLERLQALCGTWPASTGSNDEWLYAVSGIECAALQQLRSALHP